jgi:hypothetical protein
MDPNSKNPYAVLFREWDDIKLKCHTFIEYMTSYEEADYNYFTKETMMFRNGWNSDIRKKNIMNTLISLLEEKGFTRLEYGMVFSTGIMPNKTFAFFRFHESAPHDISPRPEHLLMSTHHESLNLAGFIFSWSRKLF